MNKNIIIREKNETLKKIYTYIYIYIYIFKVKTISGFTVLTSKWAFYQILFDRSIKSNSMVSQLHGALPPHGVLPPPMLVEWYLSHAMRIWVFSMGSLVLAPEGGFGVGLGIRIFKLVPKKKIYILHG